MIRFILPLVVWYFSFGLAATYGGIWQSQATPAQNARLQFIGGDSVTGTLRRALNRDWVITKADGSELRVPDDSDVVLSFAPTTKNLDYWQKWRAWMPVVGVTLGFVMFLIWPWPRRCKTPSGPSHELDSAGGVEELEERP